MSDWRDAIVGNLLKGQGAGQAGARAAGSEVAQRFGEARDALNEAIGYIVEQTGESVSHAEEEGGRRHRWTYRSRSLVLRQEPGAERFVLSVTTDRDYHHADFYLEEGRFLSCYHDRVAPAAVAELVEEFVGRFFVNPEETPK
jgi:hypothetical protein